MSDERCRITVVGASRRVSGAVPALAPVGEYVPRLAEMCGQTGDDGLPPAWSLALAGGGPVPVDISLAEAGAVDGQVLYLRDLTAGDHDEPVITDIEEQVADAAARRPRSRASRSAMLITHGLLWLAGAACLLAAHPAQMGVTLGSLSVLGLALLAMVWALGIRATPVSVAVRLGLALTAVPCLGAAGAVGGQLLGGGRFLMGGALLGANVAALMALAILPDAMVLAVELQLAVASALAPLAMALHANPMQTAAIAVAASLVMLAFAPRLSGLIATVRVDRAHPHGAPAEPIGALIADSNRLLIVLTAGPVLATAAALPVLVRSTGGFAVALAALAGAALLIRGLQTAFTGAAVLLSSCGLFALFVSLVAGMRWLPTGAVNAPVLALSGLAVLSVGLASLLRPIHAADGAEEPAQHGDPFRRRPSDVVAMVCSLACAPLVLGVFGVYGQMFGIGHTMIH